MDSGLVTMGEFLWYPEKLNIAIAASFQASLAPVLADAERGGSTNAGATIVPTSAVSAHLAPTGIGAIVEEGAKPHRIEPKAGGVLYLKELDIFVSGGIDHPGRAAEPYLHPAAERWAHGGYNATANVTLNGFGF